MPDFWIDKYEVTNRQYREFVAAGGYHDPKFWKQPFIKDGRTLSFEQAMAEFKDATGRPGPAGWQFGTYPEGKDEFPAGGVSWYEAAAYAEFAGKSLPTTYHWHRASGASSSFAFMAKLSNFGRNGPAKVGSHAGVSPVGTYDMAGNVREWCWNAVGGRRYILGGGWNDSGDMCMNPENRPPFDRVEVNGFRCIRSVAPVPEALLAQVDLTRANHAGVAPVSEEVFRAYRAMFSYDRTELRAAVEGVEEDAHWRKERITFAAAYGGERVPAYLFLPKNSKPPFQTVIYAPSMGAFFFRGRDLSDLSYVTFPMLSGRAVMYPIYKGTHERGTGAFPAEKSAERDMIVQWRKDLGRAIDYLETRPDIDVNRLAFYGLSLGGFWGPVLTQADQRFKASVLLAAGLSPWIPLPEIDAVHYLPRNHLPTLLIAGHDDYIVPVETNQKPLMRLLGTAPQDKRHVILDWRARALQVSGDQRSRALARSLSGGGTNRGDSVRTALADSAGCNGHGLSQVAVESQSYFRKARRDSGAADLTHAGLPIDRRNTRTRPGSSGARTPTCQRPRRFSRGICAPARGARSG
jgi:dienelactone hydrolase